MKYRQLKKLFLHPNVVVAALQQIGVHPKHRIVIQHERIFDFTLRQENEREHQLNQQTEDHGKSESVIVWAGQIHIVGAVDLFS